LICKAVAEVAAVAAVTVGELQAAAAVAVAPVARVYLEHVIYLQMQFYQRI
jgi:hypothetical protein